MTLLEIAAQMPWTRLGAEILALVLVIAIYVAVNSALPHPNRKGKNG